MLGLIEASVTYTIIYTYSMTYKEISTKYADVLHGKYKSKMKVLHYKNKLSYQLLKC